MPPRWWSSEVATLPISKVKYFSAQLLLGWVTASECVALFDSAGHVFYFTAWW